MGKKGEIAVAGNEQGKQYYLTRVISGNCIPHLFAVIVFRIYYIVFCNYFRLLGDMLQRKSLTG